MHENVNGLSLRTNSVSECAPALGVSTIYMNAGANSLRLPASFTNDCASVLRLPMAYTSERLNGLIIPVYMAYDCRRPETSCETQTYVRIV